MKISKIILLLFLCIHFNLYASNEIPVKEVITTKGLKFLFVENNNIPKISLNVTFKEAGYAYENQSKQGLSCFTSSVIQEGSGNNDAKNFAKMLENRGIRLNFYTGLEDFTISLDTLSENLEEGISLLSDAIIRPKVDSDGFNRTLEMAKVQFNHLKNDPNWIAKQELDRLLFNKHPYSRSECGTLETIATITRDDIFRYIRNNFTKDNIVISVVGSVKREEVSQLLDKYLSKLPSRRSKVRKIPIKNDFGLAINKHIFMNIPQSVILFAQKGLAHDDSNYYNAVVLINALGGIGLNSLLMNELRQNLGITYGVNLKILNNRHADIIFGSIHTDSSTSSKSISAIKEVLGKVKEEGIDEKLFKNTKATIINAYISSIFSNNDIIKKLDNIQLYNHDIDYVNNFINNVNDVKIEEINELAKSLLSPEGLFFVEVGRKNT